MTIIRATGTSTATYAAELAEIAVSVSVESQDRWRSIATANEAHNAVVARALALRESGDAVWHRADAPTTYSYRTVKPGTEREFIIVYRTSSTVRVRLSNLELVGSFMLELSEAGHGTDVSWSLTDDSRADAERAARRDAVARAGAVADDYAEALGTRIARVVAIDDADAGAPPIGGHMLRGAAPMSAPVAEVSVPEITVQATVRGEYETER